MRLAKNALVIALLMLATVFTLSAQILRSEKDNRNIAPTVGTGGPVGGATGLFTVYDGQTLRKGEFTFSAAYSNFDRDPGDVDITEVPVSFQIGLSNHLELFFNTDAYRAVKVNSPLNLSSFYLPNIQVGGASLPAIVLATTGGSGTNQFAGRAIFRPAGSQPFVPFPFVGGSAGGFGFSPQVSAGPFFGFPAGTNPTLGAPTGSNGNSAATFPGIGSIYGSILPGVVFTTQTVNGSVATIPVAYSTAPSYLPDAPLIGRSYGESSFGTMVVGGKFRLTSVKNSLGLAILPFYRFTRDKANSVSGFNQLQRGSTAVGNRGDFGVSLIADARVREWLNVSGNVTYINNSSIKGNFPSGSFTLLDRPDEFQYAVGLDFPANKHFQPILEFRQTKYIGARTPNVFENDPMDGLAGVRIFPKRWFGVSFAYRYNFNQQDSDSIQNNTFSQSVFTTAEQFNAAGVITGFGPVTNRTSSGALNSVFRGSDDPHGFIIQIFAGHRNKRGQVDVENKAANVTALDVDKTTVVLPCPTGYTSTTCTANQTVGVKTTAVDPEGDVLTYSYTVSGGRITGQGANVSWDLTGVRAGTYTITSAVDDGCGFCGTPKTTSVTVAECSDCKQICVCPTISVSGPSDVTQGGTPVNFTANVSGGNSDATWTYNWSVSQGTISSGQGTPSITVDTSNLADTTITATVEIGGTCGDCNKTASASASIAPKPIPPVARKVDEIDAGTDDDVKARIDNFYVELNNDPTATGTIINYGTDKEVAKRIAQINKAINFLKKDASKITFVRGGSTPGIRTEFYVVPQGAAQPAAQ